MSAPARDVMRVGTHTVDWTLGMVTNGSGSTVVLRAQALAVFKLLAAKPGELASKDELMCAVWPNIAVTDDSLVQCITEIRKALEDDGHTIIKTMPKRGYVFEPSKPAGDQPSLVVLPFANLSNNKEQTYLADGITEDLTTELARVPGLFVVSRNGAFTYKDKSIQPAQIAKDLGVRYVLEGSTRRVGDGMRINAQLIDTQTGGHLWAERFDGQWADVFALQDKVVANVADALKLRLVSDGGKGNLAGGTGNPAAYEVFLRGLELAFRDTPEDIVKAVKYYEQALTLDPNFGRAQAKLAMVYWNVTFSVEKALGLSEGDWRWKLDFHLEAAAKHPSPTYYQILAQQLVRQHRSDEAIAGLQRAVALDPSDPWNYLVMSHALIFNGRAADGLTFLDASMKVDPSWTSWRRYQAGLAYFCMDRFDDAITSFEKIDLKPDYHWHWSNFYSLIVRISADGHLGRSADVIAARQILQPFLAENGITQLTRLTAQDWFVFKNEADIHRLLVGLDKAGIPELPANADSNLKDRLTDADIRSLVFGHELKGRQTRPNIESFIWVTTPDGSTNVEIGQRNYKGTSWTQAGVLCTTAYPMIVTRCGPIFRSPSGTFEQENKYVHLLEDARYEFSIVK